MFATIVVVSVPRHVESIESDIAQRTERALRSRGIEARVGIDGRDVVLVGRVDTGAARRSAEVAARGVWGIRSVVSKLEIEDRRESRQASRPERREVSAVRSLQVNAQLSSDRTLTLTGAAPSDEAKQSWLAEALALYPHSRIQDRISVRRPTVAAPPLESAVVEGLVALRELEEGWIDATPSRIYVSGKVRDDGTERRITERLRSKLPRGYGVAVDVYVARKKVAAAGEAAAVSRLSRRPTRQGDPAAADVVGHLSCEGEPAGCEVGLARLDSR